MSVCKITRGTKKAWDDLSQSTADSLDSMGKNIQKGVRNKLSALTPKIDLEALKLKTKKKLEKQKADIQKNIISPYQANQKKNRALMFVIDVCILIVVFLFIWKAFPLLKKLTPEGKKPYSKEQFDKAYNEALNLPETAFTQRDLEKRAEYRKSYQDYDAHYRAEDPYSPINIGEREIRLGDMLRSPMTFFLVHILPYIILAYIMWFIVKYIKYLIAAIWGYLVMMYQYTARKIRCKLAEKWYIRMITGWEKCSVNFNRYYNQWKHDYVTRPIARERVEYLKAIRDSGIMEKKERKKSWWERWMDGLAEWWTRWKQIYIDLPLQELYLRLIEFHPVYVERPYRELLWSNAAIRGKGYESRTKSGKVCKCPPRKTVAKKLEDYLADKNKQKDAALAKLDALKGKMDNAGKALVDNAATDTASSLFSNLGSCETYDEALKQKKNVAKIVWATMLVGVIATGLYSYKFGYPAWLRPVIYPMTEFTATGARSVYQGLTILFLIVYAGIFVLSAVYSSIPDTQNEPVKVKV